MSALFGLVMGALLLAASGGGGSLHSAAQPSVSPQTRTQSSGARPIVVGVGDSIMAITLESSVGSGYNPNVNYMGMLTGVQVVNLAQQGYWAQNMITNEVPKIPANANVVVIGDGTNDVQDKMPATDFDALVSAVRITAPHARLIFLTARDFVAGGDARIDYTAPISAWNANIRNVAKTVGATVLDMEHDPQWYIPTEWFDGVHPTAAGAHHIARVLNPMLF